MEPSSPWPVYAGAPLNFSYTVLWFPTNKEFKDCVGAVSKRICSGQNEPIFGSKVLRAQGVAAFILLSFSNRSTGFRL